MVDRNKESPRVHPGVVAFSPDKVRRVGWTIAACLTLSSCDVIIPSGPSAETAFLDREVIPKMIKWWQGTAETFSLSSVAAVRDYDKICLIGEYWGLEMVGKGFGPVDSYHSTFGNPVPENFFAVVVIRKRVAHAIHVPVTNVDVGVIPGKLCVSAEKAVLRRTVRPPDTKPYALLEQVP